MNRIWVKALVSALLLCFAVPVYLSVYMVMCFLWGQSRGYELFLFNAVGAFFLVILLVGNYIAIGCVLKFVSKSRRMMVSVAILPLVFYMLWMALLPSQSQYHGCDRYSKVMNGGVHTFEGKDYRIELCGIDGGPGKIESWGPDDDVRLQVFSMDGELLAERFFNPGGMVLPMDYGDTYLMYWYVKAHKDRKEKIAMPPSRWEWIKARLPRLWP